MILAQRFHDFAPVALRTALDETIIRIVEMNDGIKDTALTIAVIAEMSDHPDIKASTDPQYAAIIIAKTIHKLIHAGRLVAVDCETPKGSFTFVMPAGSRPSIAMPVYIVDNRTRH